MNATTDKFKKLYGEGDGTVKKLADAGFAIIGEHGGNEGWREREGRAVYVDYYGGVWAEPTADETSWQSLCQQARESGKVSLAELVKASHFTN